jgi:hypothetical protein
MFSGFTRSCFWCQYFGQKKERMRAQKCVTFLQCFGDIPANMLVALAGPVQSCYYNTMHAVAFRCEQNFGINANANADSGFLSK